MAYILICTSHLILVLSQCKITSACKEPRSSGKHEVSQTHLAISILIFDHKQKHRRSQFHKLFTWEFHCTLSVRCFTKGLLILNYSTCQFIIELHKHEALWKVAGGDINSFLAGLRTGNSRSWRRCHTNVPSYFPLFLVALYKNENPFRVTNYILMWQFLHFFLVKVGTFNTCKLLKTKLLFVLFKN